MFPENISKNYGKVKEITFSDLTIDEKMRIFDSFGEIEVLFKNNIKTVKKGFDFLC